MVDRNNSSITASEQHAFVRDLSQTQIESLIQRIMDQETLRSTGKRLSKVGKYNNVGFILETLLHKHIVLTYQNLP